MWIAKLKTTSEGSIFGEVGKRFNIKLAGYPLSYQQIGDKLLVKLAGLIIGKDKDKLKFINYIKNHKKIKRISINNDYLICLVELPKENAVLYNPEIIWIKPAIIYGGYENIEIASWDKKNIIKLISYLEKYGCEILSLKQGKTPSISLTTILPELTNKQKQAFELAVEKGYYDFPKKISLPKLAKIIGISYSTFQAHLKKAESKIMPFVWTS